uniref:Centrosomal protein 95 n=1 Tax=Nothoprocta perdicaria TaxID=30464 RepID=A0A8C7EBI9_NOTPE
ADGSDGDWVDIANDLLRRCHINQQIKQLSECGADVFIRLYESILGEKVPDFIATPRSQEDDAHNIQAVIDSLALDYLQVSLSHITGEYLSQTEIFIPPCDVDGSGSTNELIRLGEPAQSLLEKEEGSVKSADTTEFHKKSLSSGVRKLGEPIRQAIPLLPPFQPSETRLHYSVERDHQSSDSQSATLVNSQGLETPMVTKNSEESVSHIPTKEKLSEQELHEISEKLSRRLNELDLVSGNLLFMLSEQSHLGGNEFTTKCVLQEFIAYICLYLVVKVKDDDLLFQLLEEFPHLHISHHTMKKMCQQQLAQIEQLKAASGKDRARLKLQNEVQQALKKHELLADIIKKDQDHNQRLQEFKQRIYRQKWAQSKVREKRQQIARARKYYEDYRVQLRAKMMRARTREERIFKSLFEEGLEIQKQRLKDLRTYAQEKRAEQRREHQNELESMENYYKDQFSMLAEALSQERQEIQTREKVQAQMLRKTKRELRSKMEKEIQQLQTMIMQNDDDTFFQELEADRLRSRLEMASFQYSKSSFF